MSYYMGDYYRGGFFSFIKGAVGGLARGILGLPAAQPKFVGPTMAQAGLPGVGYGALATNVIRGGKAIISKHPVLSAAAAAGALAAAGGGAMALRGSHPALAAAGAGGVMRGFHISKKTGAMVKNRHMHVTNPRALRRAIRRTHGFAKLAMKVIKIHHPQKKGRFGGYRRRKKK